MLFVPATTVAADEVKTDLSACTRPSSTMIEVCGDPSNSVPEN